MKKFLIVLSLLTGCGYPETVANRMEDPEEINKDLYKNDGYQHVEQRLGRGSEKIAEFSKGDDGKIESWKNYTADRKDSGKNYFTDRIVKPTRSGETQANKEELARKDAEREAELAAIVAEVELAQRMQDAAIELNTVQIQQLNSDLTNLSVALSKVDDSLWFALAELENAMLFGDEQLEQEIMAEISRIDADIAQQAHQHITDIERVSVAIKRLRALSRNLMAGVKDNARDIRNMGRLISWVSYKTYLNTLDITRLEADLNSLQTLLDNTTLIQEIVDPCGDGSGADEVVLITNDGVLAYQRFVGLAVLSPGHYRTDDRQRCRFEIDSNGNYVH
jgi:hypothetical protein